MIDSCTGCRAEKERWQKLNVYSILQEKPTSDDMCIPIMSVLPGSTSTDGQRHGGEDYPHDLSGLNAFVNMTTGFDRPGRSRSEQGVRE